jgi:hypothetical protein
MTGLLDIAGAVLLFVPRWTCYGAIVLACSVGLVRVEDTYAVAGRLLGKTPGGLRRRGRN